MTPDQVKKLAAAPESDVLEFKNSCPRVEILATLLTAFANTRGGTILLGVADDGTIMGVEKAHDVIGIIRKAARAIAPDFSVDAMEVPVDGKSIIAVVVEKGLSPPCAVAGKAYQRVGARTISIGSPDAPDLQGSAYQAVLRGSGVIAQGVGAVAAGERGIAVGGDFRGSEVVIGGDSNIVVSYDRAFERVAGSTAFVTDQLELSYRQTREQSQGWYRLSAFAAGGGFLIVLAGVVEGK